MNKCSESFRLYANCIPVKGARRSIIIDLQRNRAQFIPNDLFEILTEFSKFSVSEIKHHFGGMEDETIDEYLGLLETEDYGFWCDEPDLFPPLDLTWDRPETVTNAIIDIDRNSKHDYHRILEQLDELGCQSVQMRFYDTISIEEIEVILSHVGKWRLRHMDLLIKFQPELTSDNLVDLCLKYQVISGITVHSSPKPLRLKALKLPVGICFLTEALDTSSCGQVSTEYFSPTMQHVTEALHFNTCLNRKISIAANGDIKGCPSMDFSCGNITVDSLSPALKNPILVQLSSITKDQVSVCKDCEFRYICTDCRVFLSEPGDLYSKPEKCSYDPYTATWGSKSDISFSV